MTENPTRRRYALSPRAIKRLVAATVVTVAVTPAVAAAQPADAGAARARAQRTTTVLTGVASVQHRSTSTTSQDLRAPDQVAPGTVAQDQRAPDRVAPAPSPAAHTTGNGGLEAGWIAVIAGAGVLLAAAFVLTGRRTHLRSLRRRSLA